MHHMLTQAQARHPTIVRDTRKKPDDLRIKIASSQPSEVEKDWVPVFKKLPAAFVPIAGICA
jgi:hypothetical protein